jgi:hypothetical protein
METKTVRITLDPGIPASQLPGRLDVGRVDATTDADIAAQHAADEAAAMQMPPNSLGVCAGAWD